MAFIVHGSNPFGGMSDAQAGPEIHQPNPEMALVCVGCDNYRAPSYDDLKEHYKSEWHRSVPARLPSCLESAPSPGHAAPEGSGYGYILLLMKG